MLRPTYAELSKSALWNNIQWARSHAPDSKLMVMVKANAYGHGLRSVSMRTESWVDAFGVATLDEAVILRQCGITKPIHVMQGIFQPSDVELYYRLSLTPVIYRWDQLEMLSDGLSQPFSEGQSLCLWFKIETGLNRLGFAIQDVPELMAWRTRHQGKFSVGLMTHWACADDARHPHYNDQYSKIAQLIEQYPAMSYSINNSAGLVAAPEFNCQWVRIGAAIYGINLPGQPLKPVMTLKSQVIQRRRCAAGESVGYGATYLIQAPTEMAVVTIGYGDGYPRSYHAGMSVVVRGRRCPIIGRVSMDMLAIDVSLSPEVQVGDEVILWGDVLSVDEVSSYTDMIPYQLVTAVHNRVRFQWNDHMDNPVVNE